MTAPIPETGGKAPRATTHDALHIQNCILEALLAAESQAVSGERLSEMAGVSRTAVWKHIKSLEAIGFRFHAAHKAGYRLDHTPDVLLGPLLRRRLPDDAVLGNTVQWLAQTDSTNKAAMVLAAAGARHGTLVTASEQTGGRGRRGRAWFSPKGGLWMSLVLQRPIPLSRAAELTLMTSVAVRRAVAQTCGITPDIKWPNDLLIQGRKVCGILAEIRADGEFVQHAVLGIGLNSNIHVDAFPDDLLTKASSLAVEVGRPVENLTLAAAILRELEPMIQDLSTGGVGFCALAEEWRTSSVTLGRHIRVQTPAAMLEGEAVHVDDSGVLHLRLADGQTVPVHSGDVLF